MLALHSIGSTRQEAQDPITQGGVKSLIPEFDDMLGGSTSIEQHFHIYDPLAKVMVLSLVNLFGKFSTQSTS